MGSFSFSHTPQTTPRAPDVQSHLLLPLEKVHSGVNHTVQVQRATVCPVCGGLRFSRANATKPCHQCGGRGTYAVCSDSAGSEEAHLRFKHFLRHKCEHCRGKGYIITQPCAHCQGSGVHTTVFRHTVHIPPGTLNGRAVVVKGQGHQELGSQPGDLVVIVHHAPHDVFYVDPEQGLLMMDMQLTFIESLLGFARNVTLLGGGVLVVTRGGVTLSGMQQEFPGAGLPSTAPGQEGTTGPLMVVFHVSLPNQLSLEQREVLSRVLHPGSIGAEVLSVGQSLARDHVEDKSKVWDSDAHSAELWATWDNLAVARGRIAAVRLWLWRLCFADTPGTSPARSPTRWVTGAAQYAAVWTCTGKTLQAAGRAP